MLKQLHKIQSTFNIFDLKINAGYFCQEKLAISTKIKIIGNIYYTLKANV